MMDRSQSPRALRNPMKWGHRLCRTACALLPLAVAVYAAPGIADSVPWSPRPRAAQSRQTVRPVSIPKPVLLAQACLPCTPGCFDTNLGCQAGTTDGACGSGGATCINCGSGKVCQNQACVPAFVCGAGNCSGCCSNNQCVTSETNSACGSGGASCAPCSNGSVCFNDNCCAPIPRGTACTGHTCDQPASDGCGGVYSCDFCPQGTICGGCQPGQCFNVNGSCF